MDYVIEVVTEVFENREQLRGMKFVRQPKALQTLHRTVRLH